MATATRGDVCFWLRKVSAFSLHHHILFLSFPSVSLTLSLSLLSFCQYVLADMTVSPRLPHSIFLMRTAAVQKVSR